MKGYSAVLLFSFFVLVTEVVQRAEANEAGRESLDYSLEQLLDISVTSASSVEETLKDAPAAMIVLTQQDIQQRGYSGLVEVLVDLPGFDTSKHGGPPHFTSYQRGYRTGYTSRTLLMINGIVDNALWDHVAVMTNHYPLSNVERIEVLYGPVGAIYGPNAFLGVINIVTKDAAQLASGENRFVANVEYGSFDTVSADLTSRGKAGDFSYTLSAKFFQSDGPDLDDFPDWGYSTEAWLDNSTVWGPVLDREHRGISYGEYANRSEDVGLLGDINYGNFSLGFIWWEDHEGYGHQYAFDHVQPNQTWRWDSKQLYMKHKFEPAESVTINSLIKYRTSREWGGWIEATPDWNVGLELFSYVSISDWNTTNSALEFRQDYDWILSDEWRFNAGIKFEEKQLTKAYDVCNYWDGSFCSTAIPGDLGPHSLGSGIFHSSDATITLGPGPRTNMPSENEFNTIDKGIFIQTIWDSERWRITGAVRWDENSDYGSFVKPRTSAIYRISEKSVVKLLYSEAFQEPQPSLLWGGWSGLLANPELEPEEMRNLELVYIYQQTHWLHDMSFFVADYENVIKEDAENAGERIITGFEYRGRFEFSNFIREASDITGYTYYTFTQTRSSTSYDHDAGVWVDEWENLGDIAPHKINLGFNVPVNSHFNVNLRANWVSESELYLRNSLREDDRKNDSYTVFDMNVRYSVEFFAIAFKVNNLFDEQYYHPGVEQANSGDDFFGSDGSPQRAQGFRNSLLPQVGRNYMLTLQFEM